MKNNNLNWRDRRSLQNVSNDAKIQLTDGTHIDATDVKDIAKKVDTVIGTGDTTEQIDTLNEVLDFLKDFDNTDNLNDIINSTKSVEITNYIGEGRILPIATSYTCNGMPVAHYRVNNIGPGEYNIVFCIGHSDLNEEHHDYIQYEKCDEGFRFIAEYSDDPEADDYAPVIIRAMFDHVLPGENLDGRIITRGLMTLEDKQKLDNAITEVPETDLTNYATKEEVENNEKVTAAALVDLNKRLKTLEDKFNTEE